MLVRTQFLNHPTLTLGYRLELDGISVVYACDHEQVSKKAKPNSEDLDEQESRHVSFLTGADLVIHDAQYTAREYGDKVGWGHSTVEYAVAACEQAGARRLLLTHHDPTRDDQALDSLVSALQRQLSQSGSSLEVSAAAEQEQIELTRPGSSRKASARGFPARSAGQTAIRRQTLLLGTLRPKAEQLLNAATAAEEVKVVNAASESDLAQVTEVPSVVMVDSETPRQQLASIYKLLRSLYVKDQPETPFVVITYGDESEGNQSELSSIATDWLTWPFSEQYARTKIRSWLLRTTCRWIRARLPSDEKDRLAALQQLQILDTPMEERYDRITRLAADALSVPIALISLVDENRQWFKSCIGLDVRETGREEAFCAHAVVDDATLVVSDTLLDERFADNPLVVDAPHIRFYAGCPVHAPDGHALGTLCIIDTQPRQLQDREVSILENLAAMVETELAKQTQAA